MIFFLLGLIAGLVLPSFFAGAAKSTGFGHEHDFEPIPWDDATMGSPFWGFPESDDLDEHYAKKCTRCGEVRKAWAGPPGNRVPEAPIYRGSWTKAKFEAWVMDKVKADMVESRRRQ